MYSFDKKGRFKKTHGMTGTRFNVMYKNIIQRTKNPLHNTFSYYGGKGIKCEWDSFESFMSDMYQSYLEHSKEFGEENTSIDRINNEKNYCKENCRWIKQGDQAKNRKSNTLIEFNSETKRIGEWDKHFGFYKGFIRYRLNKGLSMKEIEEIYG